MSTVTALCTFLPITGVILHLLEVFMTMTKSFFFLAHHHMSITQARVTFKIVSHWSGTGINQLQWMVPGLPHCYVTAEN